MKKKSLLAKVVGFVVTVIIAFAVWNLTRYLLTLDMPVITLAVAYVSALFGWRAIKIVQPGMFIWMPLVGWLLYVIVKLLLALAVGTVAAPYKIGKTIGNKFAGA